MEYVYLIAASIVILTCFYFIVSPFFSGDEQPSEIQKKEDQLTLDQVYGAVNEIEMDYLMKKITAEDFERLKEQYQLLAAELLKKDKKSQRPDKFKGQADEAEDEILKELSKLRKQKG